MLPKNYSRGDWAVEFIIAITYNLLRLFYIVVYFYMIFYASYLTNEYQLLMSKNEALASVETN